MTLLKLLTVTTLALVYSFESFGLFDPSWERFGFPIHIIKRVEQALPVPHQHQHMSHSLSNLPRHSLTGNATQSSPSSSYISLLLERFSSRILSHKEGLNVNGTCDNVICQDSQPPESLAVLLDQDLPEEQRGWAAPLMTHYFSAFGSYDWLSLLKKTPVDQLNQKQQILLTRNTLTRIIGTTLSSSREQALFTEIQQSWSHYIQDRTESPFRALSSEIQGNHTPSIMEYIAYVELSALTTHEFLME